MVDGIEEKENYNFFVFEVFLKDLDIEVVISREVLDIFFVFDDEINLIFENWINIFGED